MTSHHPRPQGLSIGELSRRTGLAPATIRMWETRHGFPVPERLQSGHRRYAESDVALVRQVQRRRDAGVRLDLAIREALAARRTPGASVFAELRRRRPQLVPQLLRKSTLLALTWAMEDECCAAATRPMLFAAFQHERFYRRAQQRWAELSRTAERAVVFAAFENVPEQTQTLQVVDLPWDTPMRREWSLVCDAPGHAAALAAWELPGQQPARDGDRLFETLWTLEPGAVRDAARACAGLVEQFAPELADGFGPLDDLPAEQQDQRAAVSVFGRLLSYVDPG